MSGSSARLIPHFSHAVGTTASSSSASSRFARAREWPWWPFWPPRLRLPPRTPALWLVRLWAIGTRRPRRVARVGLHLRLELGHSASQRRVLLAQRGVLLPELGHHRTQPLHLPAHGCQLLSKKAVLRLKPLDRRLRDRCCALHAADPTSGRPRPPIRPLGSPRHLNGYLWTIVTIAGALIGGHWHPGVSAQPAPDGKNNVWLPVAVVDDLPRPYLPPSVPGRPACEIADPSAYRSCRLTATVFRGSSNTVKSTKTVQFGEHGLPTTELLTHGSNTMRLEHTYDELLRLVSNVERPGRGWECRVC